MKNLFPLSFLILISLCATSQQYGWTDISANLPEQVGFNDVHFIGDEGWITGVLKLPGGHPGYNSIIPFIAGT